jgi:hypothetical protein
MSSLEIFDFPHNALSHFLRKSECKNRQLQSIQVNKRFHQDTDLAGAQKEILLPLRLPVTLANNDPLRIALVFAA